MFFSVTECVLQSVMNNEPSYYSSSNIYSEITFSRQENRNVEPFVFQKKEMRNPIVVQQPSSQYVCAACGKSYMWKCTLQRHVKLECGKPASIQCPVCPYKTKRPDELKTHLKRTHRSILTWD